MVREQSVAREAALSRVMEQRRVGRGRPTPLRVLKAAVGLVAGVAAVPLVPVLPELGVPLLLLALRLLAVEFDWAARGYAWVIWRWGQVRAWYHGASAPVRALVVLVLLALAAGLVWLFVHELL